MHTRDGLHISAVNTAVVAESEWSKPNDRVLVYEMTTGVRSDDPEGTWATMLSLN